MFARILFKALTMRTGRVAVALAAIMVGATVVSALTNLYFDISIKMSEELRTYGANFFIGPATQKRESGIDQAVYDAILERIPGDRLVGASPYLYGLVHLDRGDAVLAGVSFDGLRRIAPYWQVTGAWIGVDFDDRNCMIGTRLAAALGVKVGDFIQINNRDGATQTRVRVKGIVETGKGEDEQIFVNLPLAQTILGMDRRTDFAMLSIVARGGEADALARELNETFEGVEAKPIRKISESDGQILGKIDGLMALVAAIILIISTLCVNATLTAMVAERTQEIGLQKALGASNRAIVAQFMSETAIIALAGVLLGMALGVALAQVLGQAIFNAWVTFRPVVLPLTVGVSLLAALTAAVLPLRGAVAVVPARVLRGE
ncbi:MAG: ABC transporter permease [Rhodoplanes sp.]|jgi:putative ABC transport system permease protein